MQHLDPVTAAAQYAASIGVTAQQRKDATERAIDAVMADVDTLHDWLAAQAAGETVCVPYQLQYRVTVGGLPIEELANHELLALMWNGDKDVSYSARLELTERYQDYRKDDIEALANKMLVEVEV